MKFFAKLSKSSALVMAERLCGSNQRVMVKPCQTGQTEYVDVYIQHDDRPRSQRRAIMKGRGWQDLQFQFAVWDAGWSDELYRVAA